MLIVGEFLAVVCVLYVGYKLYKMETGSNS